MAKDPRYERAKILLNAGNIKSFAELFDVIPMSIVAKDIGKHNMRFAAMIENRDRFTIKELRKLARLFEMEPLELIAIALKPEPGRRPIKKK